MTFIIAEGGVNHGGRLDHAITLTRAAAQAGCDAIKWQAFTPVALTPRDYEKQAMLKGLALTRSELSILAAEANCEGIEFLVTPMDVEWLEFVVSLGVKRIKVGSAQARNLGFMHAVGAAGLPVIISNGMCADADLDLALSCISAPTTVMSCVSQYPTPDAEISIGKLRQLRKRFPNAEIGFSCHSRSMWPSIAAAYAGATCVEKHIAIEGTLGPDISSSLTTDELKTWVREIREASSVLV